MPMSELNEKIRATLAELHAELQDAESLDAEALALLSQTAGEIEAKLKAVTDSEADAIAARVVAEGEDTEQGPLEARLADAARRFDETHPTVSGILGTLSNLLSRLGI